MTLAPPKLIAPPGACDTHIHFYDAAAAVAPGAPMPGDRTLAQYRAVQARLGLTRVVVVQPNAYVDDNRLVLGAIAELGANARGVAVVKPGVSDGELERLTRGGIRGVRIMKMNGGTLGFDVMDALMARLHAFGWFANLQLDGRTLPQHAAQIARLPGRFVIDHTGKFLEPVTPDDDAFRALLRLVDTGRCWVKLAGPYETSKTGAPCYDDVSRLARALVAHAPERMLWASNWPHPSAVPTPPDDADLLDLLLDWAPDARTRARILVDNPAELYGFGR
ncbi:MAG TPA: amidohydrolase family protein [Polyangia bacterium]|jgi:D-galactarolactone isomerase|nr:amidohydrolase family protein [Polyangia bacterium]